MSEHLLTSDQLRYALEKLGGEFDAYKRAMPTDARFQAACAAIQSVSCGIIAAEKNRGSASEALAEAAVEIADALLAALAQQEPKSPSVTN